MRQLMRSVLVILSLSLLVACSAPSEMAKPDKVADLSAAILALGPDVDPNEAARAAQIAFAYSRQLAADYEITDPPLVHNIKVNAGIKVRGLCWHWAEDMQTRLNMEGFETLKMHRAIAEHPFRIDHSTAIIGARGDTFDEGIVLDPWRTGGTLHWVPVLEDARYDWQERSVVLAARRDKEG